MCYCHITRHTRCVFARFPTHTNLTHLPFLSRIACPQCNYMPAMHHRHQPQIPASTRCIANRFSSTLASCSSIWSRVHVFLIIVSGTQTSLMIASLWQDRSQYCYYVFRNISQQDATISTRLLRDACPPCHSRQVDWRKTGRTQSSSSAWLADGRRELRQHLVWPGRFARNSLRNC